MQHATWLSECVLLAVGPEPLANGSALEAKTLSLDGQVRSDGLVGSGFLFLIRFPDGNGRAAVGLQCAFEDLRSLCRYRLAGLTPEAREAVLAFLVESLLWDLSPPDKLQLATSLRQAREALRERLPLAAEAEPDSPGLYADAIVRVDDVSFYATGAIQAGMAALESLVAVSPEGSRTELAGQVFSRTWRRLARSDGAPDASRPSPSGFAAYFSLPVPSLLPDGWKLEMRNAGTQECEAALPLVHDLARSRRAILDHLADGLVDDCVMEDHVFPALSRMQARRRSEATVDRVVQFGRPAVSTHVSVLVTLDDGITMLEHQLAQLARDPDMQHADLIYVLDSDSPDDTAIEGAAHLYELYRVPFRLVKLARQAGFAAATDAGTSLARGRLVVLLGPHVLPDRPGWSASLASFHDAREGLGAVGAKLLGPSATVRHAGFNLVPTPDAARWLLQDRSAGARRRSAAVKNACRVQAVSASCLMIDRARLDRLGGLSGRFVKRDFEAADLCLRLNEAGHEIWLCADVELYDLDRGRTDRSSRAAQRYDEWAYTKVWGSQLTALVSP
jgi:GT2 family glycosyltransferase